MAPLEYEMLREKSPFSHFLLPIENKIAQEVVSLIFPSFCQKIYIMKQATDFNSLHLTPFDRIHQSTLLYAHSLIHS